MSDLARLRLGRRRVSAAVLLCALLTSAVAAQAETLTAASRAEIGALLARLATSGCEFGRNGSWHSAAEARAHLQRKLDYLVERKLVASAEEFIERAASRSSLSGQPYRVRCGGRPPLASGSWLAAELQALRASARR